MITRKEAKEIIDFVLSEVYKKGFPYITDGKIDLSKTVVGPISGTQSYGGGIADGAIWDRHVHPNADIQGTKIRLATELVQGVVTLGTGGSALVPTMSGLLSTVSGLGAGLIGIYDGEGEFVSDTVEEALHELIDKMYLLRFIDLIDVPSQYTALWNQRGWIPVIDQAEAGLEFKPVHYIEGGAFTSSYAGVVTVNETPIDGGSFTENIALDGGSF
jgi:hypothetical protein